MTRYSILFLLLAVISCTDENMVFNIGEDNIEINTQIQFVDTFTVNTFTVMLDSIRVSGLSNPAITVGQYDDEEFGTLSATSYFRVVLPSSTTLPDNAVFDSLQLYVIYNEYYTGDTTAPFTMVAHRLSETLKSNEDGHFYNNSQISAMPEVFGTVTCSPRPHSADTLWIGLDQEFGQELFDLMYEKNEIVKDNEFFLNYFKGFKLTYGESNKAIFGFKFPISSSESGRPAMRMFYHYYNYTTIHTIIDFPVQPKDNSHNRDVQFNQFTLTDQKVDFPVTQKEKLDAASTEDQSYLMAGVGIVTRVEIPYLKNLYEIYNNVKIVDAELVMQPVRNSYREYALPEFLNIYISNKRNDFGSTLYDKYGNPQYGNLVIDDLYQEETQYSFDVTNFLKSKILEVSDEIPSLLITVAPDNFNKYLDRAILGSQMDRDNPFTLKLYYMHYE